MYRFKKLEVWKKAMVFCESIVIYYRINSLKLADFFKDSLTLSVVKS